MVPGQKILTRVGSGQPIMVGVWIQKISPKNLKYFNFFPLRVKKNLLGLGEKVPVSNAGRPLIYCGSKVSSGQGPSLPSSEEAFIQSMKRKARRKIQELIRKAGRSQDHVKRNTESLTLVKNRMRWETLWWTFKTTQNHSSRKMRRDFNKSEELRTRFHQTNHDGVKKNFETTNQ